MLSLSATESKSYKLNAKFTSNQEYDNRGKGVFLVLTAGIFWSFAGLAVRLIEFANEWQILFYRSSTLLVFLSGYLLLTRGRRIVSTFRNCGMVGFTAGASLSLGFTAWIHALTHTSVANALFLLSTAPFIAAILGRWILAERVPASLFWFILLATFGVAVMVAEGYQLGTMFGTIMALMAAASFAVFAVLIRKGRNTELEPAVFWAGLCAALISGVIMLSLDIRFSINLRDWLLCASMGVFQVGVGLVLFTRGAKYLPAAEITLLSLTEIVLGPIWVWLVIREVPGILTIIGGIIVLSAIAGQSYFTLRKVA